MKNKLTITIIALILLTIITGCSNAVNNSGKMAIVDNGENTNNNVDNSDTEQVIQNTNADINEDETANTQTNTETQTGETIDEELNNAFLEDEEVDVGDLI